MLSVFKSNIFKGFLFVVFIMCDCMSGVSVGDGMLKNDVENSITISSFKQFCKMTEDDLKDITNIIFENQNVDDEFCDHWFKLGLDDGMETLSFKECEFSKDNFYIFDHLCVNNLVFNNCGISADDVDEILCINPDLINSIDLSNNNLGLNAALFCENLKQYIFHRCNPKFILKGNNFDKNVQKEMEQLNKNYGCSVDFIFN